MANTIKSINIAKGQMEGIVRMMADGRKCDEVLAQMRAARASLNSAINSYIMDNMDSCLDAEAEERPRKKLSKLIKELLKN